MSTAGSSIIAPAEGAISRDLHIDQDIIIQLIFAIFLLGFVAGPLFLAPLSEIYGRAIILRLSNLWFVAFTLGSGFAQTTAQMLVCRFFSGLGACAPQTVGGGVLSDCFRSEERGKALALYSLAPMLGPSIGPLIGGFITANTTWRWCFWALTIAGAAIQVCLWLFLPETYPARLLHLKASSLQKTNPQKVYKSELELEDQGRMSLIERSFIRPGKLIGTQVIIQYLCIYMGLNYGIFFLMLSTFPRVWSSQYNESIEIGGLNYISIGIGMSLGAQTAGYLLDKIYARLKNGLEKGKPEYRIPVVFLGTILTAVGLFIYGWTAAYRVQWIVPNIGDAIFACGCALTLTSLQTYIIDAYPRYAASAIGVTAMARSMTGFGFPLFADAMYNSLGYGWGNSVLGFGSLAIGTPGAIILWYFGERLRQASPYAAGD